MPAAQCSFFLFILGLRFYLCGSLQHFLSIKEQPLPLLSCATPTSFFLLLLAKNEWRDWHLAIRRRRLWYVQMTPSLFITLIWLTVQLFSSLPLPFTSPKVGSTPLSSSTSFAPSFCGSLVWFMHFTLWWRFQTELETAESQRRLPALDHKVGYLWHMWTQAQLHSLVNQRAPAALCLTFRDSKWCRHCWIGCRGACPSWTVARFLRCM